MTLARESVTRIGFFSVSEEISFSSRPVSKFSGMASSSLEKDSSQRPGVSSYLSPLTDVYDRFSRWRTGRGLTNPGSVENLTKEVKSTCASSGKRKYSTDTRLTATHLTNFIFDGARADLTKALSISPAFQVTHSFALASQTQLPSYNFAAIYANSKVSLLAFVTHSFSLTMPRCSCMEGLIMRARSLEDSMLGGATATYRKCNYRYVLM